MAMLSPVSMPLHDRYAYTGSDWTAVHSGYTEVAADEHYVETGDDWTWTHTSYDDSFDYEGPEPDAAMPDRNALWAAVHGAAPGPPPTHDMEDAVVTGTGSAGAGGEVSLSLQRDTEKGVPMSTTSVDISVAGTDIHKWEVFPDISPTLDLHLDNVPPGIQTIQVKAYSNGRVVGTLSFSVTVAPKEKAPAPKPRVAEEAAAGGAAEKAAPPVADERAAAPPTAAPAVAPQPPQHAHAAAPSVAPEGAAHDAPPSRQAAPAALPHEEPAVPVVPIPPHHEGPPYGATVNPASAAFVAGQAMASGQGIAPDMAGESLERKSGSFSIHALREAMGGTMDGQGGRRGSWRSGADADPQGPRDGPPGQGGGDAASGGRRVAGDGFLRGSGAGSLMTFEGAVDLMSGFQDRDEAGVWKGALKSVAGGLTFGGVASVNPLLIGMGAALYEGAAADGRMARGDTGAWRTLGGWLKG